MRRFLTVLFLVTGSLIGTNAHAGIEENTKELFDLISVEDNATEAERLLSAGVDISFSATYAPDTETKYNFLQATALWGRKEIAKIFIKRGLWLNLVNNKKDAPLHIVVKSDKYSSSKQRMDMLELLLYYGGNPYKRDANNVSVIELIKKDKDHNLRDAFYTHQATPNLASSKIEEANRILQIGIDSNDPSKDEKVDLLLSYLFFLEGGKRIQVVRVVKDFLQAIVNPEQMLMLQEELIDSYPSYIEAFSNYSDFNEKAFIENAKGFLGYTEKGLAKKLKGDSELVDKLAELCFKKINQIYNPTTLELFLYRDKIMNHNAFIGLKADILVAKNGLLDYLKKKAELQPMGRRTPYSYAIVVLEPLADAVCATNRMWYITDAEYEKRKYDLKKYMEKELQYDQALIKLMDAPKRLDVNVKTMTREMGKVFY